MPLIVDKFKMQGREIEFRDNDAQNKIGIIQRIIDRLSSVAYSGDYNDLSNKPSIPPSVVVDQMLDIDSHNAVSNNAVTEHFDLLSNVAYSGDYNDLSNKPTIPIVDLELNADSEHAIANKAVSHQFSSIGKKYDASIASSHMITYFKRVDIGDITILKFYITLTQTIPAWTPIAYINDLALEYSEYSYATYLNAPCLMYVGTSGALQAGRSLESGKEIFGSITIMK